MTLVASVFMFSTVASAVSGEPEFGLILNNMLEAMMDYFNTLVEMLGIIW
jgi:hypothetical protein